MPNARFDEILEHLAAVYRHDARQLEPKESHLSGPGHQLLATRLGDLDCLGTIDEERGYDDLLLQTEEMSLEGRLIAEPPPPPSRGTGGPATTASIHSDTRGR